MVAAPRTARKRAKTNKTSRPRLRSYGAQLLARYLKRRCHCPRPATSRPRGATCAACGRKRKKGLSLQAFGTILDLSRGQVGMYTSGRSLPSLELAVKIERVTKGEVPTDSWVTPARVARVARVAKVAKVVPASVSETVTAL